MSVEVLGGGEHGAGTVDPVVFYSRSHDCRVAHEMIRRDGRNTLSIMTDRPVREHPRWTEEGLLDRPWWLLDVPYEDWMPLTAEVVRSSSESSVTMGVWRKLRICDACGGDPGSPTLEYGEASGPAGCGTCGGYGYDDPTWWLRLLDDAVTGRHELEDSEEFWAWCETRPPGFLLSFFDAYDSVPRKVLFAGRAVLDARKRWEEEKGRELSSLDEVRREIGPSVSSWRNVSE